MGYIYFIQSPSGNMYIGQTIRPIHKRLKEHKTGQSKDCVALYNAIQKYGWKNFDVYWYECPDEDLNDHEEAMIKVLETLSPNGYNLKEGGANGKHSEGTKQKMSKSSQGEKNPMWGQHQSEDTRKKMSKAKKGKPKSEEHRQHIGEALQGKTRSEEYRQKMTGEKHPRSKEVYQYDLEGTIMESFGSTAEAGRHLNKTSGTHICACALGKLKTAYGFKWSYMMDVFM